MFSDPGIVPLPVMGLDFSDIHKNKGNNDALVSENNSFLYFGYLCSAVFSGKVDNGLNLKIMLMGGSSKC